VLGQRQKFDEARVVIRDAIEAATQAKKDKKKKDYVASQVQKAKTALVEAKNSIKKDSTKAGVSKSLDDIETLIHELRTWATADGK
jgi:hypothetical protein